jgi:hypothetical protein
LWPPPIRFLIETVVGTLIFCVVAGCAAGVQLYVHALQSLGIDMVLANCLKLGEYLLLACDIALYVRFLAVTFLRNWKSLTP